MILVFDGPEKAGKTTLVQAVRSALTRIGVNVFIRKLGPCFPDDRVYGPAILADAQDTESVIIWDRSWAAEAVYAKLLGRQRRLINDWFLGEWLYGRTLRTVGAAFMVFSDTKKLSELRDKTDLPVLPTDESESFKRYTNLFGWTGLWNDYTTDSLNENVDRVLSRLDNVQESNIGLRPPEYVGPQDASVLIVGNTMSRASLIPGGVVPFTSWLTTKMGRELGHDGLKFGWTNFNVLTDEMVKNRELVILCGRNFSTPGVSNWSLTDSVVVIDHPSYTYRFNRRSEVRIVKGDDKKFKQTFRNYMEKKDGSIQLVPNMWT